MMHSFSRNIFLIREQLISIQERNFLGEKCASTCDRITICSPLNLGMEYRAFVNNFSWQNKAEAQQVNLRNTTC